MGYNDPRPYTRSIAPRPVASFGGTGLQKKLRRVPWEEQQIDQFSGSGMADKLAGKVIAPSITNPSDTGAKGGFDMGKVASGVDNLTPYISNVVNALRKPPKPIMGKQIDRVKLGRVSNAQELNDVDSGTRSANMEADRSVDGQTAAAIKGANLAQGFNAKSRSNAQNAQINTGIANSEAQMNLNVDAQNAAKQDQYNQDKVGYQMAFQREQSQNLANFADKRMAQINAQDARELDEKKFNVLSQVYTNGIVRRATARAAGKDEADVTADDAADVMNFAKKAFGGKLRKIGAMYDSPMVKESEAMFATGGKLGDGPGAKPGTYQSQGEIDAANLEAKRFSMARNYANPQEAYVARKVGDPKVQYTNLATGKPYQGEYSKIPSSMIKQLPDDVTKLEWDPSYNQPYYKDGETMNYVDTKWWNHPRFTQSKEAQASTQQVLAQRAGQPIAKHQLGGPLVSFPKMRGKLRKIMATGGSLNSDPKFR